VHDGKGKEVGVGAGKARQRSGNPAVAAKSGPAGGNREQRRAAEKQAKAAPKKGAFGQLQDADDR